jgi:RNA polymerase sigma-70 factor (ECF subfamily)
MPSDPGHLLLKARGGDEGARGVLFESYRPYLDLLARMEIGKRLQTKFDASDVVQDAFLEAHRNFGNFRGTAEPEFAAWLREILAARLSNLIRHFVGTRARDIRREQGLEIDLGHSSRLLDRGLCTLQTTPSQHAVSREQGVLLAQALAQLPDEYREVVVLRQIQELPFAEVADRMGRSVDSVQKLWVRALARLRHLVKDTSHE